MISFLELALAFIFIFLLVGGTLGGVSLLGWLPNSNASSEPSKLDAQINTSAPNKSVKASSRLTAIPTTVYYPNPQWLEDITREAESVRNVKNSSETSRLELARVVKSASEVINQEFRRAFPTKIALMEGLEFEPPGSDS